MQQHLKASVEALQKAKQEAVAEFDAIIQRIERLSDLPTSSDTERSRNGHASDSGISGRVLAFMRDNAAKSYSPIDLSQKIGANHKTIASVLWRIVNSDAPEVIKTGRGKYQYKLK